MNINKETDVMGLLNKTMYTPLKEGTHKMKIDSIGLNSGEFAPNSGFYIKDQIADKNNNYIRLNMLSADGKRITRNIFPESFDIVVNNIKRQMGIEDDISAIDILQKAVLTGFELDVCVWYREGNKNVDFYDVPTALAQKEAIATEAINKAGI